MEVYGVEIEPSLYYLYSCASSKCKLGNILTTINRKTLEFNVYFMDKTPALTHSCKKINENKYKQEEKKVLDKYFKDYKI